MLKKVLLYILSACCLVCCALALTACKDTEGANGTQQEQPGGWTLESAYAAACDLGYEGTLDEFLELIKGKDGADGTDGVDGSPGISVKDVYITESGHLMVVLSDNTEIDCGEITYAAACKHEYTEWRLELEPTCASIGYSTRVCKLCGNREYDFIAAKGHSFGESKNIIEPTCQEAGLAYSVCSECGIAELWEVKASGHKIENWIIEEYAHKGVCELCGETIEGEHDLASDGRCKECGVQCKYSLGLAYTIDKNEVTITGIGSCADKDLVIPDRIEGLPVTAIGYCAFRYDSQLESISIPASINYIGNCAFDYCKNLKGVYISDLSAWCNATIVRHGDSWASGSNPLFRAGNLYLNGKLVTELVIPDDVTVIQDGAFWGCTSIESIYIPAGVISINDFAFAGCINISRITVSSDNKIFYSTGNCIIDRAKKSVFMGCKTSVIPADGSVTSIGREAFQYCRGLTSITIPNTISTISSRAFMYCENLTDLTIPYGVTYIGSLAFEYCKSLKSIVIPDSVTHIGNQAFADCANLASITVPDSVTKLSSQAFSYTAYYYNESNWDGEALYIGNHLVATKSTIKGRYTIKDGTLTVCDRAFSNRVGLTEIVVPSSVVYVGDSAFTYCENLKNAYYEGTPERWKEIVDFSNWVVEDYDYLRHATIYYYSEQAPSDEMADNYFWHYVDGEIVVWDSHIHSYTNSNVCDECGYVSLEYQLADGYYVVTGLGNTVASLRKDIHLYIPDEYKGIQIKEIADFAFSQNANILSVTIPNSVKVIGQSAFYGCKNLVEVIFAADSKLEIIGGHAFSSCVELTGITIPQTVKEIGKAALAYCGFTSIVIPESVTKLGERVLAGCEQLKEVKLPSNLTEIPANAFDYCKSLTSVTIPEGVTSIKEWAFARCASLAEINIPDGVTFIGTQAFRECRSLKSAVIPRSVEGYLSTTFSDCTALEHVEILGSVSIMAAIFNECSSLKSVVIPATVTRMNVVFRGCAALESVYYCGTQQQWQEIEIIKNGGYDENGFISDATIYFYSEQAPSDEMADNYFWHYVDGEIVVWNSHIHSYTNSNVCDKCGYVSLEYQLADGYYAVTGLGKTVASLRTGIRLYIPAEYNGLSVKIINSRAFDGSAITSVVFPESITQIGQYAFNNCAQLEELVLPDSLTTIQDYAFYACSNLRNVTIGAGLNYVGWSGFGSCFALENVYVSDLIAYCGIEFKGGYSPMWYAENLYLNGNLIHDLVIPEGVTSIGCGAFRNAKCLRSVTFPVSLQRIDGWAFNNCENIKAVYISDMAAWCEISFGNIGANPLNQNDIWSDKGNYLYLNGEPVIDLVIPEGVTSIGDFAFSSYDKIESVTIPQTVMAIGNWAFSVCKSLKAVYISDLSDWCNIDFDDVRANPLYEAGNLYVNGELITDLVIPNGVTSVKNNVFAGGNFNSVAIPESVASIGEYAFMNCTNLTDVRLPDGVTEISTYAFAHCIGLKSIVIPDSVTMIDRAAFVACSVLERVYYGGNAEQWEEVTIAASGNNVFATVGIYFYSEQNPYADGVQEGNFWHYVDGKIEVWVKEN